MGPASVPHPFFCSGLPFDSFDSGDDPGTRRDHAVESEVVVFPRSPRGAAFCFGPSSHGHRSASWKEAAHGGDGIPHESEMAAGPSRSQLAIHGVGVVMDVPIREGPVGIREGLSAQVPEP